MPPARAADDAWTGPDKTLHFALSTVAAASLYALAGTWTDQRHQRALIAVGGTLILGAAKEGLDSFAGGTPSWKDFAWDAAGAVTGAGLAWLVHSIASPRGGRAGVLKPGFPVVALGPDRVLVRIAL